jgi:hypothetical protein
MYEKRHQPLAPKHVFFWRVIRSLALGITAIAIMLFVGMLGYHYFENMGWIDAYVNAAMILGGMGPLGNLATVGGKIFAGTYALFCGLVFILIIGLIFAPVIHRAFHMFHLEGTSDAKLKTKPKHKKVMFISRRVSREK